MKTMKPKLRPEIFQQHTERVNKNCVNMKMTGREVKQQKFKHNEKETKKDFHMGINTKPKTGQQILAKSDRVKLITTYYLLTF